MLTKDVTVRVKATGDNSEGGVLTAYAATFDREPDSYGDVIAPGAFTRTLQEWKDSGDVIPLLYGHRTDDPDMILGGVDSVDQDETGLLITASLDADNPKAQAVRRQIKAGRLAKMSFAFDVPEGGAGTITLDDGREARELRDITLYEVSVVPIPANSHAEIVDIKAAGGETHKAAEGAPSASLDTSDSRDVSGTDAGTGTSEEDQATSSDGSAADRLGVVTDALSTAPAALSNLSDLIDSAIEALTEIMDELAGTKTETQDATPTTTDGNEENGTAPANSEDRKAKEDATEGDEANEKEDQGAEQDADHGDAVEASEAVEPATGDAEGTPDADEDDEDDRNRMRRKAAEALAKMAQYGAI